MIKQLKELQSNKNDFGESSLEKIGNLKNSKLRRNTRRTRGAIVLEIIRKRKLWHSNEGILRKRREAEKRTNIEGWEVKISSPTDSQKGLKIWSLKVCSA